MQQIRQEYSVITIVKLYLSHFQLAMRKEKIQTVGEGGRVMQNDQRTKETGLEISFPRGEREVGKGYMVKEGNLTWGSEHTLQYTDDTL